MKKLTIIIPVFNEKFTIERIIRLVNNAYTLDYKKEIIVVDDGSNDGTENILKELKKKFNFILIQHPRNLGKGAAVRKALSMSTGNCILIQDADLEYRPQDYPRLLMAFDEKRSPVVYGSRNLLRKNRGYFHYFLGGKFLTILCNVLFKAKLTDIMTGYKLFREDIIKNLKLTSKRFDFCEEVTAKILKAGYHIKEVPIHYYPREFSQGKKIRFWDGLIGAWTIIKCWLK